MILLFTSRYVVVAFILFVRYIHNANNPFSFRVVVAFLLFVRYIRLLLTLSAFQFLLPYFCLKSRGPVFRFNHF